MIQDMEQRVQAKTGWDQSINNAQRKALKLQSVRCTGCMTGMEAKRLTFIRRMPTLGTWGQLTPQDTTDRWWVPSGLQRRLHNLH